MGIINCHKCSARFEQEKNKYCINCGAQLNVAGLNRTFFLHSVLPTTVCVLFSLLMIFVVYKSAKINYITSQDTQPPTLTTTNPAYVISPQNFIVDTKNDISDLPEDGKSVWVEKIIDSNSLLVSYIILKGGETFITFATIDLYKIGNIQNNCMQNDTYDFLRRNLEHKYVYLDGGCKVVFDNPGPYERKYQVKRVAMLEEDLNEEVSDNKNYNKLKEFFIGKNNMIDINKMMIMLGYAYTSPSGLPTRLMGAHGCNGVNLYLYDTNLKNQEEVAKIAGRGFWGKCN